MAFAQGSRSRLSYIKESTFGETPATPTFIEVLIKSHSLGLSKELLEGEDITADRLPRVARHGPRQAAGSVEVDLRSGDYDTFLESALFNTFSSNVLKVGTTIQSMSIEDAALDISQYRLFTGMVVGTATINIAVSQMVQATFDFVGKNMAQSNATAASSTTAATNFDPFDSFSGELYEGGTSSGNLLGSVTGVTFTVENSLSPTFVVGEATTPQLEFGRANVSGEMTVYYEDDSLIDKFLDETESSLRVSVDDSTGLNQYTFDFPRIKYSGADVPIANPKSRLITLPFVSLYDSTEGSNIVITKA